MAKHIAFKPRSAAGTVSFNMTPMIDCTFQLIIFFILASQIASKALSPMELHRPEESQAVPTEQMPAPNKVIVNVLSAEASPDGLNPALAGKASRYEIDGATIGLDEMDRLADVLRSRKQLARAGEFYVEIRADYRVNYGDVQAVMQAAAAAEIANMNITALTALPE